MRLMKYLSNKAITLNKFIDQVLVYFPYVYHVTLPL